MTRLAKRVVLLGHALSTPQRSAVDLMTLSMGDGPLQVVDPHPEIRNLRFSGGKLKIVVANPHNLQSISLDNSKVLAIPAAKNYCDTFRGSPPLLIGTRK